MDIEAKTDNNRFAFIMTRIKRKRERCNEDGRICLTSNDHSHKEELRPEKAKKARSDSIAPDAHSISQSENDISQNVKVVARLRPLSTKEKDENAIEKIKATPGNSTIKVDDSRNFEYDAVFVPGTTQSTVYGEAVGDAIKSNIFKGFNVTILAYGQTGSGKTFTMGTSGGQGGTVENPESTPNENDGIIPRAVFDLFQTRQTLKKGKERVKIEMSYLEIYNEEARDLFGPATSNTSLHIRDSKSDGVYVQNLTWRKVDSPNEVSQLMESAATKRATASTHMNAVSSRSHAICTLTVTIAPLPIDSNGDSEDQPGEEVRSKLTLVDLAGSERIKRTGAEGSRMKEGININKGLFVLGQVVSSLSELGQQQNSEYVPPNNMHIPYRDSKLTRLLQDSLGGNSQTILVACVSPADSNVEESINTLRYAQRARNIKNSAVRNITQAAMSHSEAAALRRENQILKIKILELESRKSLKTQDSSAHSTKATLEPNMSALNIDKLEVVAKLRTKCALLESTVEQLENKKISAIEDALKASLKADKMQHRLEQLLIASKEQGITLPSNCTANDEKSPLIEQMRTEIAELKSRLGEEMADAAVARATAAAIIASNGDLTAAEEKVIIQDELDSHQEEKGNCKSAETSEEVEKQLAAVSGDIEQKEAMAKHLEKEKECMEVMRSHFESALENLQREVEVLTAERDKHLSHNNTSSSMRSKIKELEKRIKKMNEKADEHRRSLRMRELAEKKCVQLANEIKEDKKRRATLQRQIKKESEERRSEQKVARQQAARLLRDSNRLKVELQKVKDTASRQAAVLKRKAAEAVSRQKKALERERKRSNMLSIKSQSIRKERKSDEFEDRQVELRNWLNQEIEISLARSQTRLEMEEQSFLLEDAVSKLEEMKNDVMADKNVIKALRSEIESRRGIIKTLENNEKDFCKSFDINLESTYDATQFHDVATWGNLTRSEAKGLLRNIFKRLVEHTVNIQKLKKKREEDILSASEAAVAKEKRKAEEKIIKMKINHSETMAALLGSTKSAMEQGMKFNMAQSEGSSDSLPSDNIVDNLMKRYLEDCNKVGEAVRNELHEVKKQQDGMQNMLDSVAKGCLVRGKNSKTKIKKQKPIVAVDENFLFEDDDELNAEDSDDSDWSPDSPIRRKRTKSSPKNIDSSAEAEDLRRKSTSLDGDNRVLENLDDLKVIELKSMLKQRGLPVSGKKSDLILRLQSAMIKSETSQAEEDPLEQEKQTISQKQSEKPERVKKLRPLRDLTNEVNNVGNKSELTKVPSSSFKRPLASASKTMVNLNAKEKNRKRKNMSQALNEAFLEFEKLQDTGDVAKRRKHVT